MVWREREVCHYIRLRQKNRENYADAKKMLGISRELWGERGNSEWIFTAVYGTCFTRFGWKDEGLTWADRISFRKGRDNYVTRRIKETQAILKRKSLKGAFIVYERWGGGRGGRGWGWIREFLLCHDKIFLIPL